MSCIPLSISAYTRNVRTAAIVPGATLRRSAWMISAAQADEIVAGECPSSLRGTLRRLAEQYLAHFEAAESFSSRDLVDGQRHRVQAARALVCMSTAVASQLAGKHRGRLPDAGHLPQQSEQRAPGSTVF